MKLNMENEVYQNPSSEGDFYTKWDIDSVTIDESQIFDEEPGLTVSLIDSNDGVIEITMEPYEAYQFAKRLMAAFATAVWGSDFNK